MRSHVSVSCEFRTYKIVRCQKGFQADPHDGNRRALGRADLLPAANTAGHGAQSFLILSGLGTAG